MFQKWVLFIGLGLLLVACRGEQEQETGRVLPEVVSVNIDSAISELSGTPTVIEVVATEESPAAPTGEENVNRVDMEEVKFGNTSVLTPYGITVQADAAVLRLEIISVHDDLWERVVQLQNTLNLLQAQAQTQGTIMVRDVNLEGLNGSYSRVPDSSSSTQTESSFGSFSSNRTVEIEMDKASVIQLELFMPIGEQTQTIFEPMKLFSDFLAGIAVGDGIYLEPLFISSQITDPEQYRAQLIAQVYAELAAVKAQYGENITYEIVGLYEPLKVTALNDLQYYLFIEPTIVVKEF